MQYYPLEVLARDAPPGTAPQQVGITAVRTCGDVAGWTSEDFYIPPSLWGAGFGGMMLHGVLTALRGRTIIVCVKAPVAGHDHEIARFDERAFAEQYRSFHFNPLLEDDPRRQWITALGYRLSWRDTVLVYEGLADKGPVGQPVWPHTGE
jgi:hypothetical protein